MKKDLTKRQREVLREIISFIHAHDYAPTGRELADLCGFNQSAAQMYFNVLERKGYLTRASRSPRAMRIN